MALHRLLPAGRPPLLAMVLAVAAVSADETWRVVDWIQPPPMPDTDDDPEEHT